MYMSSDLMINCPYLQFEIMDSHYINFCRIKCFVYGKLRPLCLFCIRFTSEEPSIMFARKQPSNDKQRFDLQHRRGVSPTCCSTYRTITPMPQHPPIVFVLQDQWSLRTSTVQSKADTSDAAPVHCCNSLPITWSGIIKKWQKKQCLCIAVSETDRTHG